MENKGGHPTYHISRLWMATWWHSPWFWTMIRGILRLQQPNDGLAQERRNSTSNAWVVMRELFMLLWWVVGGGYQLPSAILDVIIPTTHHRNMKSFPHCLAVGSGKEVWNIGQDPANGTFCIVWGHTWIYGMSVTISPGRPEIPWPGDRQVVECGQHLGTWWRTCHFFFFFFFSLYYTTT